MTANQRWITFNTVLATLTEEYSVEGGIQKKKRTVDLLGYNQTDETNVAQLGESIDSSSLHSAANYDEYRKIRNKVNEMVKADRDAHRKRSLKVIKGNPK